MHKQPEPKCEGGNMSPEPNVRVSLQPHFKKMMLLTKAGDSLTDVQWSLYLQDHSCYCIQAGVTPSHRCSVVTNCKMLVVR